LSSDLPGVNPATLNGVILYYRLMTKWSGLGDSTELSRVGLPHHQRLYVSLNFLLLWLVCGALGRIRKTHLYHMMLLS
jgi:hypothetical protein